MQTDGVFHVKVNEPIIIRRTLLEASKSLVEILHAYERFKELRIQKIEAIVDLRHTVREIEKLLKGLERELPETKMRAANPTPRPRVEVVHTGNKDTVPARRPEETTITQSQQNAITNELEKLEKELSYIESKLDNLSN